MAELRSVTIQTIIEQEDVTLKVALYLHLTLVYVEDPTWTLSWTARQTGWRLACSCIRNTIFWQWSHSVPGILHDRQQLIEPDLQLDPGVWDHCRIMRMMNPTDLAPDEIVLNFYCFISIYNNLDQLPLRGTKSNCQTISSCTILNIFSELLSGSFVVQSKYYSENGNQRPFLALPR